MKKLLLLAAGVIELVLAAFGLSAVTSGAESAAAAVWFLLPSAFPCAVVIALVLRGVRNREEERIRSEFVANVSHELKTPLASVKGYAELILNGIVTDIDIIKDYQGKIVLQSDRLIAMINDILLLSKLETTPPAAPELINTRDIAEQVRESLKLAADKRDCVIQVYGKGSVYAQTSDIYDLMHNLVDNALKYGFAGGYVKVSLDDKRITVTNNGTTISPEDIPRLFERFYRADKSHASRDGTGLGLAIVKHIALRYGGGVSIKSENGITSVFVEF